MKRYQPIFDAISQHLAKLSIKPEISLGDPVTIDDLKELEEYLGLPLPIDIRQYLLELGDGFDFRFHSNQPLGQEQHCWIWSMHSINQIKATYDCMREDIPLGLYACEDLTPRLKWIPIWGAGDGGYLFCAVSLLRLCGQQKLGNYPNRDEQDTDKETKL